VKQPSTIRPESGKLAVLLPGLGAVATTTIAGVMLARKNLALPIGSLTQMGTIRLGARTHGRSPKIAELVPLAPLSSIAFGGWDVFADDAYKSALHAEVLDRHHLHSVREELERIRPMKAVFLPEYVARLHGTHTKHGKNKADLVEQVRDDIRAFVKANECTRAVCVFCASTEIYLAPSAVHQSVTAFEQGLARNDAAISTSQIYAWACIKEGVPFANGAPNLAVDFPAAWELANRHEVPIAGKDFKTGRTWMQTVIAPAINIFHTVPVEYHPSRGDAQEGWDSIDIFGWLGYPMQLKVNFLCRDSILAAPIVLDLALFLDFAQRAGFRGIQDWLSFYFKTPMSAPNVQPEHDLFIQLMKLKNTLRWAMGEQIISHLGHEYYD
jgi:myo-inositol-1-phosphate synthase